MLISEANLSFLQWHRLIIELFNQDYIFGEIDVEVKLDGQSES